MQYAFPPDVADLVRHEMSTGRYRSEDEVMREALQALKRQSTEIAAIQEGFDDMEAGRYQPLDEADRAIRTKYGLPPA